MNKPRHTLLRWLFGALLVIALLTAATVFALQRGVELGPIAVAGIQIERIAFKLERKLTLHISRVRLPERDDTEPSASVNPAIGGKLLRALDYMQRFFTVIDIRDIEVGPLSANFHYRENSAGYIDASGPGTDIAIGLETDGSTLNIDIQHLHLQDYGLDLRGKINIDTQHRKLQAQLSATIANTLPISLQLQADQQQLSFQGKGEAPISDLAPIVALFQLGPTIDPWIIDYLRASAITLESVSGTLPYDDPAQILQTLRAEALIKDTEYTFAQGLEPVLAAQTRVFFAQGVLHIYPTDATFYGQDTGATYVDIDFNNDQSIATVFVRTRAQASGGIITLLEFYGIPFPYHQVEGLTDTSLDLRIDLKTVEVEANGHFIAKDGIFNIGGQRFDIANLDIGLKATAITFNRLEVALPGLLSGKASGHLDIGSGQGDLDIALEQLHWREGNANLLLRAGADKPLAIKYHFRPDGDSIDVAASNWKFADLPIALAAFTSPFDAGTFSGSFKNVGLAINRHKLRARVSGRYQAHAPYADINISVRKFKGDRFQLEQPRADIAVTIGSSVQVSTHKPTHLSLDGIDIKLQPLQLTYGDSEVAIQKSAFEVDPGTTAALQGYYNLSRGEGRMLVHNLKLMGKDGKPLFGTGQSIYLNLSRNKQTMHISMPRIGLTYSHRDSGGWSIDIDDFSQLYMHSPLMQQLRLNQGELHVNSVDGGTPYKITGKLPAPYGLLLGPGHQPIRDYRFTGHYDGHGITLEINRKLRVGWRDSIQIESRDIGYSLPALLDIIDAVNTLGTDPDAAPRSESGPGPDKSSDKGLTLNMQANNSFIFLGKDRYVPVDAFSVHYDNGNASAQFHHGEKGIASLEYTDGHIYFAGRDLAMDVLDDVVELADFEGGTLEFSVNGTMDDLQAGLRIKNTVIIDYKHLNNMLAFINTLPGLLTFNPPDYSNKGLPTRELYAQLTYKKGVIDLQSLLIDSDELDLKGTGIINLNNKTTDMTFNLITGAKKSITRIPLLGFILAGDKKKPTLTLKVSGDMHDPKISNTAARDIVTYPWQLIKRTIMLPDHLVKQLQEPNDPVAPTP